MQTRSDRASRPRLAASSLALAWRFSDPDAERHITDAVADLARARCGRRSFQRVGDDWVVQLTYTDRVQLVRLLQRIHDGVESEYMARHADDAGLRDHGTIQLVITPDCDGPGWLLTAYVDDDARAWPLTVILAWHLAELLGGRSADVAHRAA